MAFYGSYFTFDGVSCRDYNLMIYDFGSYSQDDAVAFGSTGTAVEDRVSNRYTSLFYGIKQDKPLTFTLTFGADCCLLDKGRAFYRPDVARIAAWLTGHNTWKWLAIEQPDMLFVRYKCYISSLRLVTYDGKPWAFNCTVTCDSPYAYLEEETTTYTSTHASVTEVEFENRSSYHGYYYPQLIIDNTQNDQSYIQITNVTDGGSIFRIGSIPAYDRVLVDGENQILTVQQPGTGDTYVADSAYNAYDNFNKRFLGLVPGINVLQLQGNCDVQIITAFPVDIGA